ncbi:hypothetical protein WA026_006884 [Henosepilachna vigintioctopunctata]|uniref:Uncharacterized protein n=1 Tax=Henosepilachna vigintioctopunctata TaxID=420089 RepID=A0AAW1V7K3_9CUCU
MRAFRVHGGVHGPSVDDLLVAGEHSDEDIVADCVIVLRTSTDKNEGDDGDIHPNGDNDLEKQPVPRKDTLNRNTP